MEFRSVKAFQISKRRPSRLRLHFSEIHLLGLTFQNDDLSVPNIASVDDVPGARHITGHDQFWSPNTTKLRIADAQELE